MTREIEEFQALFKSSGWSPADTARRLETTPASISRYLAGTLSPKRSVIALFKLILATEQPGALVASNALNEETLSDWERHAIEDLRWLHKEDRQRALKVLRAFVEGLPRREAKLQGVSSKIREVADECIDEFCDTCGKPRTHKPSPTTPNEANAEKGQSVPRR